MRKAISEFGGRAGDERLPGLVESAVGAAFQEFGGVDPYPGPFDKAAMLIRGIVGGHPFEDGNKRTGFLISALYLDQVGIGIPEELPDETYDFCMRISSGELKDIEDIAREYKALWERPHNSGSLKNNSNNNFIA